MDQVLDSKGAPGSGLKGTTRFWLIRTSSWSWRHLVLDLKGSPGPGLNRTRSWTLKDQVLTQTDHQALESEAVGTGLNGTTRFWTQNQRTDHRDHRLDGPNVPLCRTHEAQKTGDRFILVFPKRERADVARIEDYCRATVCQYAVDLIYCFVDM